MSEQRYTENTILVPDADCAKAGFTLQWSGIGKFGIHACRSMTYKTHDEPSEFAPLEAKVHFVRPDSILFEPVIRKLVNESSGTFLAGQKLSANTLSRPAAIKLSRQYRSILRACIENLQICNELSSQHKQQYITVFYNIELIWHLCEILYVDAIPGNVVLPHLLEWIRFHFPDIETEAGHILSGPLDSGAELRHSNYWEVIAGLVMQGSIEVARALLRLHSDADTEPFLQAEILLRSMPSYMVVYGGLSNAEFKTRWHTWQTNVTSKLESDVFTSSYHLTNIMKIISADDAYIGGMKSNCDTWYQLLVTLILYKDPTVKTFDLTHYVNTCTDLFGGIERMKLLDHTILALLEGNILEVTKKLYLMSDSGWCATHLTNLLYLIGQLDIKDKQSRGRIDEYLIIEYGSLLMSHNSLWQVGVMYLDHCPTQGQMCLELLLPRLKLGSEARTLKILQIATDRNLPDIVNSICKVEGMRCLQRKQVGQALSWALRSKDPGFATHIADSLLHYYAREGSFHSLDLLDNLGSCMLISDRLTFLGKYCEYHHLIRNGGKREAATLITSLFASKLCPKYFWLTLLMDSLPLLETTDPPVLSSEDSTEFLSCLEELTVENEECPVSKKMPVYAYDPEKVKMVRTALSKNISSSLIYEACHPLIDD